MQTCEYFALCDNPATVIIHDPLPIIGDVPTCKDCNDRLLSGVMGPDDRIRSARSYLPLGERQANP